MASVFVTTTARDTPWYPWALFNYLRVMRCAFAAPAGPHRLADHPADADVVLFVEAGRRFQSDITRSAMYRAYRHKALVFDFDDRPLPRLPGLYVNLSHDDAQDPRYRAGIYLRVADNPLFEAFEARRIEPELLFSFVGRVANQPHLRGRVMRLQHPRALLKDGSSRQSDNDVAYLETIYRSRFVLTPKGLGPSTWRLFETMRAGRVPVIVSDDWSPPHGPAWSEFCVRVPEADIETIPHLLEAMEARAEAMGARARAEWERFFALSTCFQWIAGECAAILAATQAASRRADASYLGKVIRSRNLARYIREWLSVRLHAAR